MKAAYTEQIRDRLLREHGGAIEAPDPAENPAGDYTSRLAHNLRAEHDDGTHDENWLRTYGRPSTSERTGTQNG
jgi:hypothetical protein